MAAKKLRSKVDRWILLLILVVIIVQVAAITAAVAEAGEPGMITSRILVMIGVALAVYMAVRLHRDDREPQLASLAESLARLAGGGGDGGGERIGSA